MKFRRFTDEGLTRFREYLERLRDDDPKLDPPTDLLEDGRFSEPLQQSIEAEPTPFAKRMDFACWLHDAATAAGAEIPRTDTHFWAWLSLALFDSVCPAKLDGSRRAKETPRYIPILDNPRRYYRHALLGPYLVYKQFEKNPEIAAPLLCGTLVKLHDEAYRLFVENQLLVHASAVNTLRLLYYDPAQNKIRRNAQSKKAPGSIRRLVKVIGQYARTFDLDIVPTESLIDMLPTEFDRWRKFQKELHVSQVEI